MHPGPVGDRGASSLDWAIELGMGEWGVTVLEATGEVDGGDIWGTQQLPHARDRQEQHLPPRGPPRRDRLAARRDGRARGRGDKPRRLDYADPSVVGRPRPLIRQPERAIDWTADSTETVVRRIRAAEGHPGVLDTIEGAEFHLFGVHRERGLRGLPGEIIATRHGGICRATVDGAVWITHLKRPDHFKLPAVRALELAGITLDAPEIDVPVHAPIPEGHTWREIAYTEHAGVGYLEFDFYNGAMSTAQCRRLLEAYRYARSRRTTKVIVLGGGSDFFSNGIHLNVIEAAQDPAEESWHNLHAIDDVVREIVETDSHLVISALQGDAAAGGVPFAMAADHVVARTDVVLNPYYQHMGGLYGSEYWTYLMPRRIGAELTDELTSAPFRAIGTRRAVEIGLLDEAFGDDAESFLRPGQRARRAARRAATTTRAGWRRSAAAAPPTSRSSRSASTAREELARSHECFFGADRSYHEARSRFVYKTGARAQVTAPAADNQAMELLGRPSARCSMSELDAALEGLRVEPRSLARARR